MLRFSPALATLAALAAFGLAAVAPAAPSASPSKVRRIELPGGGPAHPFPYTIEVPAGWTARQIPDDPGLWVGPPDATPNQDPRFVYVRISTVSLAEPDQVAAAIKQNDSKDDSWSAPVVEVREVHGVRGVLVQVDRGKDAEARSSLTLKLPLPKTSVDLIGQAKKDDFAKLRASYERILLSARPVAAPAAAATGKKPGR